MHIDLPWPHKFLNPNQHKHWRVKAPIAKSYRHTCWAMTFAARPSIKWVGPVHLWIEFIPPDKRPRDDDNMIASFKSGRDGVADALGIDDKRFRTYHRVSELTGGIVRIRFTQEFTPPEGF